MGNVLAFTVHTIGHIYPLVPVLQELAHRGHTVMCAVCGTGTDDRPIGGIPVRNVAWDPDQLGRMSAGDHVLLRRYQSQGAPIAAQLSALIAEERPDFILVDAMLWGGFIAAEASQLP